MSWAGGRLKPPDRERAPGRAGYGLARANSSNQPRERLFQLGPSALSEIELITLLVGSGDATRRAGEIGESILDRAGGSLVDLAKLPADVLLGIPGVGRAVSTRIAAAFEIGRRTSRGALAMGVPVRGARDVYALMEPKLRDLRHEEFHALLLNAQHRLVKDVTVTRGILDAAIVHPREVFRPAIEHSAAAVILVHNHPSGDPTPSSEDRAVTEQMAAAGEAVGIAVLDHVVVAHGGFSSAARLL